MKSVFSLINRDVAKGKFYFIQSCYWLYTLAWIVGGIATYFYHSEMGLVLKIGVFVIWGLLFPDFERLPESYSSYIEKKKQEDLDRKNTKVWFPNHKQ